VEHADTLVTAASIIAGFGAALIAFRLERELNIEEKDRELPQQQREGHWFPASDWLLVVSNVGALCLVVAPLVATASPSQRLIRFTSAVCTAAAIMMAGYIPSILAHYHFFYGLTTKERKNPTLWEGVVIAVTIVSAAVAVIFVYKS
jgi:hypothetical protein